jgi:5,10-methylenetetrahydromethanopterin reductase
MDFGITLATPADSWKTVERAEDAGFSTAWFYDTQVLSADIFVAMGAAAVKTDRIRLGTSVLIPSNRIVPVAANGLASLKPGAGPHSRRLRNRIHRPAQHRRHWATKRRCPR